MSALSKFVFPKNVSFSDDAERDFLNLDRSMQLPVARAIIKVSQNPQPRPDGYGKPLSGKLSGCCKIKLRDYGIRIIYKLIPPVSNKMRIIIIGFRSDEEVYQEALHRLQ